MENLKVITDKIRLKKIAFLYIIEEIQKRQKIDILRQKFIIDNKIWIYYHSIIKNKVVMQKCRKGENNMENRVVKILMERDGMTKSEAINEIKYVREMMMDAVEAGEYWEAEDILADELGLEPDYIFDIM